MPDLTVGRLLMALGLLLAAAALWQAVAWLANRGHLRGTPQYARARAGRRYALWLALLAAAAFAAGCLTPLAGVGIGR